MKNKVRLICLFFLSHSAGCFGTDTLEAYGDSITAGFMSDTNVTSPPPLKEISAIVSDLAMFIMTRDREYIRDRHAPDLAWPAVFAKRHSPSTPLHVVNEAVSGARVASLSTQVLQVSSGQKNARAFFFIGHNDLCNNLDTPTNVGSYYSHHVNLALEQWDLLHSDSTAYLVPVAEIHKVYEALAGYVWRRGKEANYRCEDSWTKLFPYCPSHYQKYKAGKLKSYLVPRTEAMNQSLKKLASKWTAKSSSNRFSYLEDVHSDEYAKKFFAIDCFHLSSLGQEALADAVLKKVQAFETP